MFHRKSLHGLNEFEEKIKKSFSKLRNEMDEHLETINDNTKEIEEVYKYIFELEEKIEKLNERIDEVCMLVGKRQAYDEFMLKEKLTFREQEVFLVLYTKTEEDEPLSYRGAAKKTGLTESLVMECIEGLIAKGVPVIKKYVNNKTYLDLDSAFKQVQAKRNVLGINENLRREVVE